MSNNHILLRNLYFSASGKYLKFKNRFDKAIHSGRFYKLNKRKQSSLVSRLKRLYERLKSLQTQLRLAGAGAALVVTLAVSNPVQAQSSLGPFERNDASNPLPPPFSIDRPRLAVVDIDNDGDLDIFAGTGSGVIEFFQNNGGPNTVKRFTKVTGSLHPLENVNEGAGAAPAFIDVDNDGDYDLLLGVNDPNFGYAGKYSPTFFFRNTGSATNPEFTEQTGSNNPFDGITGTKYGPAIPVFANMDADADLELFIGSSYSSGYDAVNFFDKDIGGNFKPSSHNLTGYIRYFNSAAMTFADLDENGELDVLVSDGFGPLRCFVECSSEFCEQAGAWDPVTKTGNPMHYFNNFPQGSPVLADFDGDGDLDLVVGQYSSSYISVRYFENTDGAYTFENQDGLNLSPLGGVDVGRVAAPTFVDLDNDGDLDAVIGSKYYDNALSVYINEDGQFTADPNHQLVDAVMGYGSYFGNTPVFVDIDDDGDQDLFVGKGDGIIFFRNDDVGNFVYETSPLDPYLSNTSLAFIDVDADGDLDAFIGPGAGQLPIVYFQNNGSASNPNFVEITPPSPFDALIFEQISKVFAIDLDHDGDTDLVVSETYPDGSYGYGYATRTRFFENKGDGTFLGPSNAIIGENIALSFTSFSDIDGDGDLDAFIGNGISDSRYQDGKAFFFENTNPPPVTNANEIDLTVTAGQPTIIAPLLTIEDPDADDITLATITISDFVPGAEELGFTPVEGVEGSFDDGEGVLTFIGRASISTYETLLRSVTFNFTGEVPGGRRSSPTRELNLAQTITFQVRDTDFTLTTILEVSIVAIDIAAGNEIVIYNAISPNKDDENANDFFKIQNIESVSPENKVTIYNRWGDEVFEVNGYNNSVASKRFEGVSDNGKDLPTGTYFYKIEITGKTLTGYLSLKR